MSSASFDLFFQTDKSPLSGITLVNKIQSENFIFYFYFFFYIFTCSALCRYSGIFVEQNKLRNVDKDILCLIHMLCQFTDRERENIINGNLCK